jgi:hypothetical protein
MQIHADAAVSYPREQVFEVYRDKLVELVPYLPNVDWIKILERREEGPVVHLVNEWKARGDIPKVARKIIKPETLLWKDFADWDHDEYSCAWRFEMAFMREQVKASGKNFLVENGPDRTRYEIRGTLEIDGNNIPGVPGMLGRRIVPQIEKFVIALIRPNFIKISDGVQQYLDAGK